MPICFCPSLYQLPNNLVYKSFLKFRLNSSHFINHGIEKYLICPKPNNANPFNLDLFDKHMLLSQGAKNTTDATTQDSCAQYVRYALTVRTQAKSIDFN